MRVALVILYADPSRGGAERYTVQIADGLAGAGHDVMLLAADADAPAVASAVSRKVARVALAHGGPTRSLRYVSFSRSLGRHLAEHHYDVVHAMLPVPPGLCDVYHPHAGVAAAANRGGPFYTRWTNPRRKLYAAVERRMLTRGRPPLVLTLSQYVEDELRRHYPGLPAPHMARLFNAVDLARFAPDGPTADRAALGAGPNDLLALFVGNGFGRKGLDVAIRALIDLPSAARLIVAGEDRRAEAFERLARDAGVADRVRFLGRRTDLPDLYRAADVLVLPTRHDPCSLVLLEALACGLPAVSTRQNGATEIMVDGEHGFVLPEPDAGRLADALRAMLDPARRDVMRATCLALRPVLSWDRHLATLLDLYRG